MVTSLVIALSAAAAVAGLAAAISDARSRSWHMALLGSAALLAAIAVIFGVAISLGGSIWHAAILSPLAVSFAALYLMTRLISAVRSV